MKKIYYLLTVLLLLTLAGCGKSKVSNTAKMEVFIKENLNYEFKTLLVHEIEGELSITVSVINDDLDSFEPFIKEAASSIETERIQQGSKIKYLKLSFEDLYDTTLASWHSSDYGLSRGTLSVQYKENPTSTTYSNVAKSDIAATIMNRITAQQDIANEIRKISSTDVMLVDNNDSLSYIVYAIKNDINPEDFTEFVETALTAVYDITEKRSLVPAYSIWVIYADEKRSDYFSWRTLDGKTGTFEDNRRAEKSTVDDVSLADLQSHIN